MNTFSMTALDRPARRVRRMPTQVARAASDCDLCDLRIKPGQRVALHFASGVWCHAGCVVRFVNMRKAAG